MSKMALSCFHYDSLLYNCKKVRSWWHLKLPNTAYTICTQTFENYSKSTNVFSEVIKYKTLNMFVSHFYCNSNLFTALCKRKEKKKPHTPLYNKHKLPLGSVCTTVNNTPVHIGTEHTTYTVAYCKSLMHIPSHLWKLINFDKFWQIFVCYVFNFDWHDISKW